MSCVYKKGNKEYTPLELIQEFIAKDRQLSSAIFSEEDAKNSTLNIINNVIREAASDFSKKDEDGNYIYENIERIITDKTPEFWNNFQVTKGMERLSPKYDEAKRIENSLRKRLDSDESYSMTVTELDEYNKAKANQDINYFDFAEFDKVLDKFYDEEGNLIYQEQELAKAYKEILEEIKSDSDIGTTSTIVRRAILSTIQDNQFNDIYEELYDDKIITFSGNAKNRNSKALQSLVESAMEQINKLGVPISKIKIVSSQPNSQGDLYRGYLDIVVVDNAGEAHIIKIVGGKNDYIHWDSAKQSENDYKLAFQRGLLSEYLDVTNTNLYILPIIIENPSKLDQVRIGNLELRSTDRHSGLRNNDKKTQIADVLFTRKIAPKYNPVDMSDLNNVLTELIPDYEFRSEVVNDDFDWIMQQANKKFELSGKYEWYNNYNDIDGIDKGWISETDKEVFEDKIRKYTAHAATKKGNEVKAIRESINNSFKTGDRIKVSTHSSERDIILSKVLNSKLNGDYEIIPTVPEAEALGIIILRNKVNRSIDILNISVNQPKAKDKASNMLIGDLENMKVMIFLNKFYKQLFPNDVFKLGDIITFNTREASHYYEPSHVVLDKFVSFMGKHKRSSEINITENNLLGVEDVALSKLQGALNNYVGDDSEFSGKLSNLFDNKTYDDIVVEDLIKVRELLLDKYPEYKNKQMTPDINFNDQIEVLFAYLQVAILSKQGFNLYGDFTDITEWSIEFEDFKSLIDAVYTKNQEEYTKAGKKIQGIFAGLAWTNPEWVRSKDLRQINNLISSGNTITGERLFNVSEIIWNKTEDYYKHIGFNRVNQMVVGETQNIHKDFFILDSDEKVNKDFKVKNPYSTTAENYLTPEQRTYLQHMLLHINRYKYGILDKTIDGIDPTNLESIKSIEKFSTAIENGEYFAVPLVRREELSRYKGMFQTPGDIFKRLSQFKDEITDYVDSRKLTQYDITNVDAQTLGYFEMYDAYGAQTRDLKARMIDKHGVDYFDLNLDTIAHRVAFASIRKQTFDLILPTINSYMW